MSRYTISREARQDLKDIYRYLAESNPSAAGRLIDLFFERFRLLTSHPLLGQSRDDLARDVRIFPAGRYVVLYRPTKSGVAIAKIVHSARDLSALFARREHD